MKDELNNPEVKAKADKILRKVWLVHDVKFCGVVL